MAESAPDSKLEDVLSSVRRLVSEELPKTERRELPVSKGALVLTNEQRVRPVTGARASRLSLEQRIAELEAAVSDHDDEFEPDGSEDQQLHRPDRIVYTRPPSEAEQASLRRLSQIALINRKAANEKLDAQEEEPVSAQNPAFEWSESAPADQAAETEPLILGSQVDLVPEAPMVEDVPTVERQTAEVTAFSNPDDVIHSLDARINEGAEGRLVSVPPSFASDAEADPDELSGHTTDEDFEAALNEAVIASLGADLEEVVAEETDLAMNGSLSDDFADTETAVSDEAEEYEFRAEGAVNDDIAPQHEPSELSDSISEVESEPEHGFAEPAPSVVAVPQPVVELSEEAAQAIAAAAVAELLDEEKMQKIVSRMIRDELQGELGERITRNVRKLVRREINRVLDAREIL